MVEQPYLSNKKGFWQFEEPAIADQYIEQRWDAIEMMEFEPLKAERLFKQIIEACGNGDISAIMHLGLLYKMAGLMIEGNALIHKAHVIALDAIPESFDSWKDEIMWGFTENRPFLRAFFYVALEYMEEQQYEKATQKFEFIIRVNKEDNQGARYLLPECDLYLGRYNEYLDRYAAFTRSVFRENSLEYESARFYALYKLGRMEEATEQFLRLKKQFPNMARELTKKTHGLPRDGSESAFGIVRGSKKEAYEYWKRSKKLWSDADLRTFMNGLMKQAQKK